VAVVALIALVIQSGMILLALFEPPLPYRVPDQSYTDIRASNFVPTLASLTGAGIYRHNRVDVFTNGDQFYPAELDAIRAARKFVHVECYIFDAGEVSRMLLAALEERARNGVQVRLLIDAIGSASTKDSSLRPLREAGGQVAWYHSIKWYSWPRLNYRTHREMVIVDGETGFAGGAGFADHWYRGVDGKPRWRDMMVRFEGDAATGLSAVFAENWMESNGEVLLNPGYFPFSSAGQSTVLVVGSAPTTGRSTYARVLLQSMVAAARSTIHLTTPYFLPDPSFRGELVKAIRKRGVEVKIVVPGAASDHTLTRTSSRRLYGDLLEAGAQIYEYQPSMTHTKCLLIDGAWSVIGSTNIDSRSFGLNDEVNVAISDAAVAQRLEQDFQGDVSKSHRVSYQEWRHRSLWERIRELAGSVVERQQ
jgi:cardiolipin synthase